MSHMVIFRTPDGKPGYQPADAVEEAVAIVERLRNEDGVENVRIYRMEEVAFEYKPYFRVQLAVADTQSEQPAVDSGEHHDGFTEGDRHDRSGDGDHNSYETSAEDVPPPPGGDQPSWGAAPDAPNLDQPGDEGHDGGDHEHHEGDDGGQRRGLFGR